MSDNATFPIVRRESFFKAPRGNAVLAREQAAAEEKIRRADVRKAVRHRDGRCQWPEAHTCRGGLECAHVIDASLGGEFKAHNLVLVCAWIHRRGPESIHGKQLRIDVDTPAGANGPRSFWRQRGEFDALGHPIYDLVAREVWRGVVEHK